jgi:hypothetical protein
MQSNQTTFDIKHFLDYKVVNIILISKINIMEVEFLRLNTMIKPSLFSKSVTEIQIIIHLARDHLTTRYTYGHGDPSAATVDDNDQRVKMGPPYPSSRLPVMSRRTSVGGPHTIPKYILEVW